MSNVLCVIVASGALAGSAAAQRGAPAPVDLTAPNVLLVVLDDVGSDKLSLFDHLAAPPYARTPHLDALAERGIRFTSFYSHSICSPSRACMQTGRYAFRTGMGTNSESWELPDSELLLAELLRKGFPSGSGYRSAIFGKWHIGQSDPGHAVDNGYDRFYGALGNTTDHFHWSKYEHDAGSPPRGPIPVSAWSPTVARKDAVRWINQQQRPFFACVAFNPPHRIWQMPPKSLLSDETRAEVVGFAEGQEALFGERRLFYAVMLEAVDTEIGLLLDGIDPFKLANTVVIVAADNGPDPSVINPPHDGSHAKPTVYQLAIRVPLIVSGALVPPAPPGGFVCDELVESVDVWPTIAAITGADSVLAFQRSGLAPPYPVIDGVSFLPLILDPTVHRTGQLAFAQLFGPNGTYVTSQCLNIHARAITDGEYKYIRTVDKTGLPLCTVPTYQHEFYRVASDNEETTDLLLGHLKPFERRILDYLSGQMDLLSEY